MYNKHIMTKLVAWYNVEYARRTQAVEDGTARIDWIDSVTRISFTEVCSKAEEMGLEVNPVKLRLEFESALRSK